jgi:hypothetical protein
MLLSRCSPGVIGCLAKSFDLDELLACGARYVQPAQAVEPSASYETIRQQQCSPVAAALQAWRFGLTRET